MGTLNLFSLVFCQLSAEEPSPLWPSVSVGCGDVGGGPGAQHGQDYDAMP